MNYILTDRRLINLNTSAVSLRLASIHDLDLLREWKNSNRDSFFSDSLITPSQQKEWFSSYLDRGFDYMFIAVLNDNLRFGCLGARFFHGYEWDIYNVINGLNTTQRRGYMSSALRLLIDFCSCRTHSRVSLKVLRSNPAQYWYLKNGFRLAGVVDNYLEMVYIG